MGKQAQPLETIPSLCCCESRDAVFAYYSYDSYIVVPPPLPEISHVSATGDTAVQVEKHACSTGVRWKFGYNSPHGCHHQAPHKGTYICGVVA